MPPISAAEVIKVLTNDANRVTQSELEPEPVAHQVEHGCLATAATRPLISPNTMIPMVEKAKTQINA